MVYRGANRSAALCGGAIHAERDFGGVEFALATASTVYHAFDRFELFVAIMGS